jgi:hypothetical protein
MEKRKQPQSTPTKGKRPHCKHKARERKIIGIVFVSQLWLNFPIHEAIAIERGKMPSKERMTNYEIKCLGTSPNEVAPHPPTCFP